MSDMEDLFDVKVTRRGREVAEGCYRLPVTIGRGEHNSVRIGHSPQDMTISRTHAIIEPTAGRLHWSTKTPTERSIAAIKQGNVVELGLADSFEIFDFKVSIGRVKPDPSIPIIFEAHVMVAGYRKGKPFMIGEMLLLCFESSQGYGFDQVPMQADLHTIFTRRRLDAEYPLAAIASEHGEGLVVTESVPHQPRITVNRKPASQPKQTLRERDVVEIGNIRIEIYPHYEKSLMCSNPACQLLRAFP